MCNFMFEIFAAVIPLEWKLLHNPNVLGTLFQRILHQKFKQK